MIFANDIFSQSKNDINSRGNLETGGCRLESGNWRAGDCRAGDWRAGDCRAGDLRLETGDLRIETRDWRQES